MNWFRRTEAQLYALPRKRVLLRTLELQLEVMFPSAVHRLGLAVGGGGPGDQTAAWVQRRDALVRRIERLQAHIRLVEAALATLDEDERRLAHLKYERQLSPVRIWTGMGISRATYFRIRRRVVWKIAHALGLANNEDEAENCGES